jgi:hypothetical protein
MVAIVAVLADEGMENERKLREVLFIVLHEAYIQIMSAVKYTPAMFTALYSTSLLL